MPSLAHEGGNRLYDNKSLMEKLNINEMRPCFAIGYDTPENYRKRYHKGELPRKNTFETRVASPEPKFVRERREKSDNKEDK